MPAWEAKHIINLKICLKSGKYCLQVQTWGQLYPEVYYFKCSALT